jgi:hypothetical protein
MATRSANDSMYEIIRPETLDHAVGDKQCSRADGASDLLRERIHETRFPSIDLSDQNDPRWREVASAIASTSVQASCSMAFQLCKGSARSPNTSHASSLPRLRTSLDNDQVSRPRTPAAIA